MEKIPKENNAFFLDPPKGESARHANEAQEEEKKAFDKHARSE